MEVPDELLGRRVALRHRIGDRPGAPRFTDAVGELSAAGPDALVVSTRRGPVRVRRDAVVAVRAIPPAVPRRASWAAVARLEGLCADAWPALVDRPLGGWRLRAAGGYTGRANSALAVGDPGMPVAAALDAVCAFAAEHGGAARVQVPVGSPWDRAVSAAGWRLETEHAAGAVSAVLVAPAAVSDQPGAGVGLGAGWVELLERPAPDWWRLGPGPASDPEPTPAQRAVIEPGGAPPTVFPLLRGPDGRPLGHLRAALVADHLHLALLAVDPAARRRGVARALVTAAAGWGRARGARWLVLQAAVHNDGARAVYRRLGFVEHHRYRYLVPGPVMRRNRSSA